MIRAAIVDDAAEIIDLLISAHGDSSHHAPYDRDHAILQMKNFIANPSILVRVIDDEGVKGIIVGVLAPVWYSPIHKTPTDLVFYVSPDFRGAGLKLLREFKRWAAGFDCAVEMQNCVTMGGDEGSRAEELFMKMGYERIGGIFTKRIER